MSGRDVNAYNARQRAYKSFASCTTYDLLSMIILFGVLSQISAGNRNQIESNANMQSENPRGTPSIVVPRQHRKQSVPGWCRAQCEGQPMIRTLALFHE